MNFIPTIKMCIKSDVKKLFHCEVISKAVYDQIEEALNEGRIPKFQDVTCDCKRDNVHKACKYTDEEIEEILRFAGVMAKCRKYIEPDFNYEGEWR